jgi:hypothetical protein
MPHATCGRRDKDTGEKSRIAEVLVQTPEGILGNGMLDADRQRRGIDRGRQDGVESGAGDQRGTERKRRWPKALDGAPWERPDQCTVWCCAGEVVMREKESEREEQVKRKAYGPARRVIGCGAAQGRSDADARIRRRDQPS